MVHGPPSRAPVRQGQKVIIVCLFWLNTYEDHYIVAIAAIEQDSKDPQLAANLLKLGAVRVDHHMRTIPVSRFTVLIEVNVTDPRVRS